MGAAFPIGNEDVEGVGSFVFIIFYDGSLLSDGLVDDPLVFLLALWGLVPQEYTCFLKNTKVNMKY